MKNIEKLIQNYHGKIGNELGKSSWFLIDQGMIDKFASLTMDSQFIHIDPERGIRGLRLVLFMECCKDLCIR